MQYINCINQFTWLEFLSGSADLKEINKSDLSEDDKKKKRKELHKAVGKIINMEVLTKEQRKAKAKAKKGINKK